MTLKETWQKLNPKTKEDILKSLYDRDKASAMLRLDIIPGQQSLNKILETINGKKDTKERYETAMMVLIERFKI